MNQLQITAFGDPSVLRLANVPDGEPAEGQVRVRVHYAGVNPIDAKTRAGLGWAAAQNKDKLPWTPGYDVAGIVEARGPGVCELAVGDRVCGMVGFPLRAGGYGESAVVGETELVKLERLELAQGAALPLAGLTGWQGLFEHGELLAGQRLLILAAAGGVGHLAVQWACAAGAEVVALASPANHDFVLGLGAKAVLDYHAPDWPAQVGAVDLVLDLVGGESGKQALACVKPGGRLITVPTLTAEAIKAVGAERSIEVRGMLVHPDKSALARMVALLEQGGARIEIAHTFPLAEGALAHQAIEAGHTRGKLLLRMDGHA
ncbi:NADP-dependent oxidoreductase [Aeromonas simiae]|uniref:NADP-dependent oxidoreductase n=1 Tax=Aeromonas simiae TaxID=218936 RepID=UPI00266C396D|nr:NADP-dependent oxidoreductase [Aeromonas simiae]MDO2948951.1 NADP-dependent oxidoreductase [Aeromonas simiae]MDO2952439.1 NADP-dependent oxidoreductase [Aeromonas simiae]MDO2956655.1 NADP-dependent oxidoreductase [Aeromonas simiae]